MAKEKTEIDILREQVKSLSNQASQALAKLERQASATPEITFAKIAEILSAMPHVDDVLIQLQSHAHGLRLRHSARHIGRREAERMETQRHVARLHPHLPERSLR